MKFKVEHSINETEKMMNKISLSLVTMLTICLSFVGCKPNSPVNPSSKFTLSPVVLQMKVGDMETIDVKGATTSPTWTSSDETVATVYAGLVEAIAIGKATITATIGDHSQSCEVFVTGSDGSALRISPYILEVNTNPGMTDTSDLPAQALACGIDYDNLVLMILNSVGLNKSCKKTRIEKLQNILQKIGD